MRAALVLMLCCSACAQDLPVVRGILLRRDPGVQSGILTLRDSHDTVLRYRFDSHTYVERENRSIEAADLKPGDPVEVVSEAVPGAPLRAARSIHVLDAALPQPRPRPAAAPEPAQGDMTFSGLILRVTATRLVLHPREGIDLELVLRRDTRCVQNGEVVPLERLQPNMRVFVRAGRDVSGNIEALQVLWGSMLSPK